jgi:hypothetical protein
MFPSRRKNRLIWFTYQKTNNELRELIPKIQTIGKKNPNIGRVVYTFIPIHRVTPSTFMNKIIARILYY